MPPFAVLFSFHGRIRRRDFWLVTAVLWLAYIAAIAGAGLLGFGVVAPGRARLVAALLLLPVFLWVAAALLVRRLHDRGHSAWRALYAIRPIFGWIWGFSECCGDGTLGANAYGPSPKGQLDPPDHF